MALEGEVNGVVAGVVVQGQIRFLDAAAERGSYVDALHAKYSDLANRWGGRAMPSDRVMFRLEPNRVSAWGLD